MQRIFLLASLLSVFLFVGALESKHSMQAPSREEIALMEKNLTDAINNERYQYGQKKLKRSPILERLAKEHSNNMARGVVEFGHGGFRKRAKIAMNQTRGIVRVAENVAYNYGVNDPLECAVDNWMNSPGHCKNILGEFEETGVGIVYSKSGYCYLTQIFAKKKR